MKDLRNTELVHDAKTSYGVPVKAFYFANVKKAVLEFEDEMNKSTFALDENYIKRRFREIFGDFNK